MEGARLAGWVSPRGVHPCAQTQPRCLESWLREPRQSLETWPNTGEGTAMLQPFPEAIWANSGGKELSLRTLEESF